MKCHECGSELDTGFNCPNCGYKRYGVAVYKTEPTTAEMLLWLLKHANFRIEEYELGFYIKEGWYRFDAFSHSKKAIKAAYLKVKQEEV